LLQLLLQHGDFLNIDISQGSVATNVKCGGIFTREFVANLSLILSAGKVMGKMGKSLVSCFFDSRCSNTFINALLYLCEVAFLSASFYRAMLCIRGTSHGPVSICLSVSVSVSVCHKPVFY